MQSDLRGNVFVEEVYGGRKRSEIIDIGEEAELPDFELIPKDREAEIYKKVEEFLADPKNHTPIVRPRTVSLPPVWKVSYRIFYAPLISLVN